ncbi:dihydrolipoyl dehydrogenase [Lysinibacillus antri]|uniref:Dihydrolipoyl dehydrogenase n=1 Tax=Lysinibacillus antri TaxID=2498145 RepID=A0A3S0RUL8_9BACI|nr:dihydrolipoyl dehydrogenase [Lysinibacillus antri]RUL50364.1 dihydrolipoyl dehydrogenase [Lysinibacillus antri]
MLTTYDVTIIGGGPGGYVAALRAASEGLKVALIEAEHLGGTCLNKGCIPSKTYLKNAELLEDIKHSESRGIFVKDINLSLDGLVGFKNNVLNNLRNGISSLLKSKKVDVFNGFGTIKNPTEVVIQTADTVHSISTKNIIVATGSKPSIPKIEGLENVQYHTTDTIFDIKEIPSSLVIVGGGVIGVELANAFNSFGSNVTIVEYSDRIIPMEDSEASKLLQKHLKKSGIKILTNALLKKVENNGASTTLTIEESGNNSLALETDQLLVAVGRTPNLSATQNLDFQHNGPFLKVNDYLQTNIANIYAIGDVIGGYQLAHVASAEGLNCIENILNKQKKMDYNIIPRCIYTNLQIASVGYAEQDLKNQNIDYNVFKYSVQGIGKAQTLGKTDGFVKLFTDPKYGEILGICMIGPNVTELISQGSAYMHLEGTVFEMAEMVQPHPSLSEIFMEVANLSIGKGVH